MPDRSSNPPVNVSDAPADGGESQALQPRRVDVHIPAITFVRVFIALITGYALYLLWPLLLLVLLSLFLAVTLSQFVAWLEDRGVRHSLSLLIVIGGLIVTVAASLALLVPPLADQIAAFGNGLPALRDSLVNRLPADSDLRQGLDHLLQNINWSEAGKWIGHFVSMGGAALSGMSEVLLLLVIAIYLVVDGGRLYDWLLVFFSFGNQQRLRATAVETSKVIYGYVTGQVITSLLVAVYAFAVLALLHVPGALMLAIVAGLFDILPVLGFLISAALTFLVALSVSSQTAFIVLGLFVLFHGVEVYLIIPKVYGKSLKLSTLSVLLGLLAGSLLAGVPGALAVLPVIASYAAIERIWLKPYLRDGVPEKHQWQKAEEFGTES